MEPILISFSICVIGVIGAVTLFSVAMRAGGEEDHTLSSERPIGIPDPFFLEGALQDDLRATLPSDAIVRQLERHFRMEEQAATSFLEGPSAEALHAPSPSPLRD